MAIPESQFDTWSEQGSITQSRDTYRTVKKVLDDGGSPYYQKSFDSFLQGSYANDTNTNRDSDVDVVMRLNAAFYHNAPFLPDDQYRAFKRAFPDAATYGLPEFKAQVEAWLKKTFNGVVIGSKAIFVPGTGIRRDCDVLVCAQFRNYYHFNSPTDARHAEGICFFLKDGTQIVNFPKQHSDNCTAMHGATSEWFKPTVRIYKNVRNYLIDSNMLQDGVAPSYFVEGMLWNVPLDKFGRRYDETFVKTLHYLLTADRTTFMCANGIHPLLSESTLISWQPAKCQAYLNALLNLWNNWQ